MKKLITIAITFALVLSTMLLAALNVNAGASDWTGSTGDYTLTENEGVLSIKSNREAAGPLFNTKHIAQGAGFKLTFNYKADTDYASADITIRLTSNNACYLRMVPTIDKATDKARVDFTFFDGAAWHNVIMTDWINDFTADSYNVEVVHEQGTNNLSLKLSSADGQTTIFEGNYAGTIDKLTNATFFNISALEPLIVSPGPFGTFTVSGWSVTEPVAVTTTAAPTTETPTTAAPVTVAPATSALTTTAKAPVEEEGTSVGVIIAIVAVAAVVIATVAITLAKKKK